MLARPQGRALPREKPQEVQLFLAFWTYTTKRKFWKPQVEKRYSASSFYKFLLHQISTPAENLSENSFFFGLRTTFGVDQSCHLTLPSTSIQDKRKTTFQDIIQPKIRILTASITRQKRPFILARIKKVKLVTNLGSQSGLSWKEHKQRHTHAV